MDDSVYSKLARSGWLGSGVQATQDADDRLNQGASNAGIYTKNDLWAKAMQNQMKKAKQQPTSDESGS